MNKVICPSCNWQGETFEKFGIIPRLNAKCPNCWSLERHRLLYLFLQRYIPTDKQLKILHFSPEKILRELFATYNNIDEYVMAELNPSKDMVKVDMTDIPFPNGYFDIVLSCGVIEHIEDDAKALSESYRVLKPNGFVIHWTPVKNPHNNEILEKTYEDSSVVSEEDRFRIFGQKDHVRIYGLDIKDRFEKAGFTVEIIDFEKELGEDATKYAVVPSGDKYRYNDGWIYLLKKYESN